MPLSPSVVSAERRPSRKADKEIVVQAYAEDDLIIVIGPDLSVFCDRMRVGCRILTNRYHTGGLSVNSADRNDSVHA